MAQNLQNETPNPVQTEDSENDQMVMEHDPYLIIQ